MTTAAEKKYCALCGKLLIRRRGEQAGNYKKRETCGQRCGRILSARNRKKTIETKGITRKPKKPAKDTTRNDNLKQAGEMLKSLRASLRA